MKKILCVIFVLITILSFVPVVNAEASDTSSVNSRYDISKSKSIENDFNCAFNGNYRVEDYPVNMEFGEAGKTNDDIAIITCTEYRYGKDDFSIYLYLYNPMLLNINTASQLNQVSIRSNVLEGVDSYYSIEYVCGTKDNLISKWKVKDWRGHYKKLNIDKRTYTVAGVELQSGDKYNATEYTIARDYTFVDSTGGALIQSFSEINVVETEVHHTYYRIQSEVAGEYADLRSVYFNIPNSVIEEYGSMEKLLAKWEEVSCYPMLVTDNEEIANLFKLYELKKPDDDFNLIFYYDFSHVGADAVHNYNFVYNYKPHICFDFAKPIANKEINILGGIFYESQGWESEADVITADQMLEHQNRLGWENWNFKYIDSSNFVDNAKEYDIYTTNEVDKYYLPEGNVKLLMSKIFRSKLKPAEAESYTALVTISKDDIVNLSDDAFVDKYKVHKNDVGKIRRASSLDSTMYLLRYTVTDYKIYDDVNFCENPNVSDDYDLFICDMVGIRNFDIIEGTFEKEGIVTVIPFIADPTNAMTGITAPPAPDTPRWLYIIIFILIVCLVLNVAIKIYRKYKENKRNKAIDEVIINGKK